MVSEVVSIWKLSHSMTKPTKWSVRPAKTQISLGIRPVWSESDLKQNWVLSYPLSTQRRLWSDWADAQADLSLRWAQKSFCWFCHEVAQNSSSSSLHNAAHIYFITFFTFRIEPNMKSFTHANNIVLRRDIYIHSLNNWSNFSLLQTEHGVQ